MALPPLSGLVIADAAASDSGPGADGAGWVSSHAAAEPVSGPTWADGADGAADEAAEPAGNDPDESGGAEVAGGADAAGTGAAGTHEMPSGDAT